MGRRAQGREGDVARSRSTRAVRRAASRRALATLALALALAIAGCSEDDPPPPRVVLLVVQDTLGAAHVSHLGYPRETTPNLDRLAAEGVAFSQAVTPATYTLASIPRLLTGRLPSRHGVVRYSRRLAEAEHTLAERLREAGYRTVALCCQPNGSSRYGDDQGFDEFHELFRGYGPEGTQHVVRDGEALHFPWPVEVPPQVEKCLDGLGRGERLFLYLHFLQPHSPYDPPSAYKRHYLDELCRQPFREGDRERIRRFLKKHGPKPWAVAHLTRLYDANALWCDESLGRVLELLRERGLFENALILSTADHGEQFYEHGYNGHGHSVFEEELRVPLVIKLPGREGPRGEVRSELVSTIDVLPTIVDYLGLPAGTAELDGLSLVDLLRGRKGEAGWADREIVCRAGEEFAQFALRRPGEKLLFRFENEDPPSSDALGVRYDLVADPREQHPLKGEAFPDEEAARARLLAQIRAGGTSAAVAPALSGVESRMLEGLGYTDHR